MAASRMAANVKGHCRRRLKDTSTLVIVRRLWQCHVVRSCFAGGDFQQTGKKRSFCKWSIYEVTFSGQQASFVAAGIFPSVSG